MKKLIFFTVFILVVAASFFYVKPLRFLTPYLSGVKCYNSVCIDDPKKLESALSLYSSAVDEIRKMGITIPHNPKFVYCTTIKCYQSFGGGRERAISFPFLGTVISPESWQAYITQHELVHWFQFSEIGAISTMRKPEWFREGMAYYFSGAPESDIPTHYLPMIEKYRKWHADKSWVEVIQESKKLK
jgi:hypothetical protein